MKLLCCEKAICEGGEEEDRETVRKPALMTGIFKIKCQCYILTNVKEKKKQQNTLQILQSAHNQQGQLLLLLLTVNHRLCLLVPPCGQPETLHGLTVSFLFAGFHEDCSCFLFVNLIHFSHKRQRGSDSVCLSVLHTARLSK